ncbi:hypothetical protein KP509_05G100000 [Ceratopteris richardii]|uniref:Uncharacterized protein n=1 Tax=Ceratopteris richardii TaxID=49495 RepID=A0A8T2UP99_CERRI|nr:hypothetical protein KP509_05G100000 [Ceratopteris richardii]
MEELTENCVDRIHGHLVLRSIAYQVFRISKGNAGRGSTVPLIIGDNLHTIILPDAHTRVGGTKVDINSRTFV